MSLLDAKFALFLLEDELAPGTARWAAQAAENRSLKLLGRLQVVERLGTNVDADDAAGSFDDNARFGGSGSWHLRPPFDVALNRNFRMVGFPIPLSTSLGWMATNFIRDGAQFNLTSTVP
jgi:hypothetical protein